MSSIEKDLLCKDNDRKGRRRIETYPHHFREELCRTRSEYRKGRKETAVKVFTIGDESKYLLVQNVPDLNNVDLIEDFKTLCFRYGNIISIESVDCDTTQQFTHAFLVKFAKFSNAIYAKKKLDDYEFYGSLLHVCYAPEFESLEETLEKFNSRKRYVAIKLAQIKNLTNKYQNELHNEITIDETKGNKRSSTNDEHRNINTSSFDHSIATKKFKDANPKAKIRLS